MLINYTLMRTQLFECINSSNAINCGTLLNQLMLYKQYVNQNAMEYLTQLRADTTLHSMLTRFVYVNVLVARSVVITTSYRLSKLFAAV